MESDKEKEKKEEIGEGEDHDEAVKLNQMEGKTGGKRAILITCVSIGRKPGERKKNKRKKGSLWRRAMEGIYKSPRYNMLAYMIGSGLRWVSFRFVPYRIPSAFSTQGVLNCPFQKLR